ncbi:hypothetical protein [Pseudoxanthomonas sp. USHLN014]|uniref:hypothetical protein n=1 Tax=Pseudoxanthomonas sp. USHLN014 TaxID=3081297 RepID=UPI00301DF9CC
MRHDQQTDLFRDDPARKAKEWRDAAETSLKQFPEDQRRYDYYASNAERWEALTR